MLEGTADIWTTMSTARAIRRFTDEPVDDATLARCLQAATWAPSGANAQEWRFIVLRSPEMRAVVAQAAAQAMKVIEPVYGMTRPADDDDSRRARSNRATYELHDRAGRVHVSALRPAQLSDRLRALARRLDLPGDAELSARCTGSGARRVRHQLGVLRRRAAAARGRRRTRGMDARRSRRGRMAARKARSGAPQAGG